MGAIYYIAIRILIFLGVTALGAGCSYSVFKNEFVNLPNQGIVIHVNGKILIDQSGGHLQGIQMVQRGEKKVAFLSGSSNEVAFMVQVELDQMAMITSVDTLMLDPYRHAGGFQIYGQYLAIGIEDNKLRNTSRVMVYDLEKENVWSDPVKEIYREGAFERVTAGAVGMTVVHGHYLIAVANWDSRHLDFYICPENQIGVKDARFRLVGSLNMETSSRKNWVDSKWRSYQNINLFTNSGDRFYLVGFATTGAGENVADLYSIKFRNEWFMHPEQIQNWDGLFSLTKVESRKFETIANTRFRWGAGLFRKNDGGLILLTSPEHIDPSSNVEWFSK